MTLMKFTRWSGLFFISLWCGPLATLQKKNKYSYLDKSQFCGEWDYCKNYQVYNDNGRGEPQQPDSVLCMKKGNVMWIQSHCSLPIDQFHCMKIFTLRLSGSCLVSTLSSICRHFKLDFNIPVPLHKLEIFLLHWLFRLQVQC